MILLLNLIVAVIGIICILFSIKMISTKARYQLKDHVIILTLKLIAAGAIIGLIAWKSTEEARMAIILSGSSNLIIFHFVEGFIIQKKMTVHRNINV